jgi:hypothetical protein
MIRHMFAVVLLLASGMAGAQSSDVAHAIESIGAGPFEFPISGVFKISREDGAHVFSSPNGEKEIRVGFMRKAAATQSPEQIAKIEAMMKSNWEKFATAEKFRVIRPFKRWDISLNAAVFGMASQFKQAGLQRHYVQYAVTDGSQLAFMIIVGDGPAEMAAAELEPLVLKVKITDTSNSSSRSDAPKAAHP